MEDPSRLALADAVGIQGPSATDTSRGVGRVTPSNSVISRESPHSIVPMGRATVPTGA